MKGRIAAVAALFMLMFCAVSPLFAETADALDNDDFIIVVEGTYAPEQHIPVEIRNGETKSWTLHVINDSEKNLNVTISSTISDADVAISTDPEVGFLYPRSTGSSFNIVGTITISVNNLSKSYDDLTADIKVAVFDQEDKSQTVENHVIFDIDVSSYYDTSGQYNKFLGIFDNPLDPPFDTPLIPAAVTTVVILIIAALLSLLIIPLLGKYSKVASAYDKTTLKKGFLHMALAFALVYSINLDLKIIGADPGVISNIEALSNILYVVIGSIIAWRIYLFIMESILKGIEESDQTSMVDMTLMPLMRMLGKMVFWIAGATIILGSFGVDLGGILVSAGIISLGITMGAQNVLSQFFSGIVLLMSRPFKAGDFLKINDEVRIVKKVKVMYTEFYNWDKDSVITMPNNAVSSATILNLTKDDIAHKQYIYFSVAYGTDIAKAEKVMIEAAFKSDLIIVDEKHSAPSVRLTNFLDSGIELRLGVYVHNFDDSSLAAGQIRAAVLQAFIDNDIEIPYNRLEVTMLNDCFGEKRPGDTVED